MDVTEFYAIFKYRQLDNAKYEYRNIKCEPDLAETPCSICGELFGGDEDNPLTVSARNKQRIAVTTCFHLFHEECIQEYITTIFREYIAAAYSNIQGYDQNNNIVTLLPTFYQTTYLSLFSRNQQLNPFGRAEPNGLYILKKTNCPLCRHPLDQRLPPNTDMKRCFIRYFMRTGIKYPDLVPRITFSQGDMYELDLFNVYFTLARGVGENIIRLRNRENTRDFYNMPENAHVNSYFRLPIVIFTYRLRKPFLDDLNLVYEDVVGEEPRPVPPPRGPSPRLLPTCKIGKGGDLNVIQAKELLVRNQLSPKGNKAELCDRLINNNLARPYGASPRRRSPAPAPVPEPAPQLRHCTNRKKSANELSLDEAKGLLRRAGLPISGNKAELCNRLRQNGLCL